MNTPPPTARAPRRCGRGARVAAGFTLVELMVAAVIGMVTVLAVMQTLLLYEERKRSANSGGDAYQNAAIAMHILQRDLSNAGDGIVSTDNSLNCTLGAVNGAATVLPTTAAFTLDPDPTTAVRLRPVSVVDGGTGSDSLMVMYATPATPRPSVRLTADPAVNATTLSIGESEKIGFNDSDLLLAVEQSGAGLPSACTVAQVTNTATAAVIAITAGVGQPFNRAGGIGTDYSATARIVNLGPDPVFTQYGVAGGELRAADLLQRGADGAAPRSMVEGVINLQAQYGVDTNGDDVVDSWQEPLGVLWAAGNLNATRVAQIKAVRVGIVVRSALLEKTNSGGNCDASPASLPILAAQGGAPASAPLTLTGDERCYRYKVLETIVPLRNVIWSPIA